MPRASCIGQGPLQSSQGRVKDNITELPKGRGSHRHPRDIEITIKLLDTLTRQAPLLATVPQGWRCYVSV